MSCHLICVDPARVHEFWPHARALIKTAMEKGDISPFAGVEHAVRTGNALLWLAWDAPARRIAAAAVTELQQVGVRKFCLIVACGAPSLPSPAQRVEDARKRADAGGGLGGGPGRWLTLLAPIEGYARAEGCAAMRIMGREGWARILPDYRRKRIILEKELA